MVEYMCERTLAIAREHLELEIERKAGLVFQQRALCGAKKLVPRTKWQKEFSAQQTGRPVVVLHCCMRDGTLSLLARKGRFCARCSEKCS